MAGVLQVGGVQVEGPGQKKQDPKAVIGQLCATFRIEDKVAKHMVETEGIESLEDFVTFLTDAADAESKIIDKIDGLDRKGVQASRVRQAWMACRAASDQGDSKRKRGTDPTELDGLLAEGDLNNLRDSFHRRYKLSFGAQVEPSDQLVSRVFKEMDRRMMQVHDVFKTKSLMHLFLAGRKKARLGDGVDVLLPAADDSPEDKPVKETIGTYLTMLFTLMLAYARAGCSTRPDAPTAPEDRGSDSTAYIEVPLDVVLKYHGRAQARAAQLPGYLALPWVRERDIAERTMWIELHRATKKSLGEIIKEVYERREAQWDLPIDVPNSKKRETTPERVKPTPEKRKEPQDKPKKAGEFADQLKDGSQICLKWNKGQCSSKCGRLHVCNKVLRNGRVCGMRNHTSANCRSK